MADRHHISSYVRDDHVTYIGCSCGWMTVSSNARAIERYHKHNPIKGPADPDAPGGVDPLILRRETNN